MKKKQLFSSFLTSMMALALWASPQTAWAVEPPEVTAPYAILVDARYNEILFEKNAYDRTYPASTTKVMTALLVAEAIEQGALTLDTMITTTEASREGLSIYGSTQGIDVGEIMSVKDLLYCLMLASANEAGNILAIALCGDLQTFVDKMNEKAQEIGCLDTHYINTHGLHDDEHYTTAYDLFLIFQEAMTLDIFAEVVGTTTYTTAATNQSAERHFYNTNGLLSEWYYKGYAYDYCIGGKTGSTPEAGRCLVSGAEYGNEYVISVVLGTSPVVQEDGSTLLPQMSESRDLLKHGIDDFERRIITPGVDPVSQVAVTMSDEADKVLVVAQGEISKTLPVDMDLDSIETHLNLFLTTMEAPVYKGEKVGEMTLSYEGEVYGVLDLVTSIDVAHSDLLYTKREIENFLADWGFVVAGGAVAVGTGMALAQYTAEKRRRRHSWRNNSGGRYNPRR